MDGSEALAFHIACFDCNVVTTVDLRDAYWRDVLTDFTDAHAAHLHDVVVQLPASVAAHAPEHMVGKELPDLWM